MRGYPQCSFWIPKDLLFPHSHKPHKNTSVLVGTVHKAWSTQATEAESEWDSGSKESSDLV